MVRPACYSLGSVFSPSPDMKNSYIALLLTLLLFGAGLSHAATVTLTFEGLQNLEPVSDYYNGGLGGLGSGPGPGWGIGFQSDSLAAIAMSAGGSGNFAGNPSGKTVLFSSSGAGAFMNVPAGFTDLSFSYSSPLAEVEILVFDGVNETGNLIADGLLPETPFGSPSCDATALFCPWLQGTVPFTSAAKSVIFSGSDGLTAYDDITITGAAPEPSTLLLIAASFAGLLFVKGRHRGLA